VEITINIAKLYNFNDMTHLCIWYRGFVFFLFMYGIWWRLCSELLYLHCSNWTQGPGWLNWLPWYTSSWNIDKSGIKHNKSNQIYLGRAPKNSMSEAPNLVPRYVLCILVFQL